MSRRGRQCLRKCLRNRTGRLYVWNNDVPVQAFPVSGREVLVKIRSVWVGMAIIAGVNLVCVSCFSQQMPKTSGVSLSGKRIVPAEVVRGHASILVAGFSHEAGMQCGPWMKAIQTDPALKDVTAYELAMLEKAPGMFRGMIKSGMRKGTSPAEQERIVVMTQDQKQWEEYFGVADEKDPYVVMLDARGDVVWHGHGSVSLEPLLKNALKK